MKIKTFFKILSGKKRYKRIIQKKKKKKKKRKPKKNLHKNWDVVASLEVTSFKTIADCQ